MLRGVDDWFAHSSLSDSCMYMYTTVKKLSKAFMPTAFSEQVCLVLLIMISVSVSVSELLVFHSLLGLY